jgi:DNA-binding CsgD family transcriptional regulator
MGMTRGLSHRIGPPETFAFLREHIARCALGTGTVVLVSGRIASGKTYLHNELLGHAEEIGILSLSATGAPDERIIEGGVIEQLLASPALPPGFSEPFTAIFGNAVSGAEEDQLIGEVCRALHRLARKHTVLLAIDDLQFVDDRSLRLLGQLQRRARSARLLMVLHQSDLRLGRDQHQEPATVPSEHHVRLAGLSLDAISELVSESLGARARSGLATRVHELSAGQPLLVSALIDDYRTGGEHGLAGHSYAKAIETLLHRLGSPLQEAATALAVLDTESTSATVAAVGEIDQQDAEKMIAILTEAGLVANGRFRFASTASATLDSLTSVTRARLHRRAAEVGHRHAVAVHEVAAHLIAAGEASADWSTSVLIEAAEQAMLTDDVAFATSCLELATTAARDDEEQRTIAGLLASITWRVNPGASASYLASVSQEATAGTLAHVDSLALARHSLWHGDRNMFGTARNTPASSPEPVDLRVEAELTLASLWHFGVVPASGALAGTDPWSRTVGTLATVWHGAAGDATSACAERILQNCRLSDTSLEALVTAILALAYDNKSDRAEGWCASLSEEAEQRGAVTWQALIDSVWASIVLRRGDVANAVRRAESALSMLSAQNWGVAISYPLTTLVIAHTASGAFKSVAEVLRRPVPEAMFDTVGGLRYLRARGHFHLATNRVLAALSDFQQCQRIVRHWDIDIPTLVPWRTDLAEVNVRLGNPTVAAELAKQQLAMVQETDAYSRASAFRVLALLSEPAERTALLVRAADCFKASGDRIEHAKTLHALGHMQPKWDQSPTKQQQPRIGKPVPMPSAPRPLPAPPTPVKPRPKAECAESNLLSDAELRVAQLAALGHTNRQIARTLFITVSTVEQHLTRVYRKLGVPGRSALPSDLAAPAPAG